MTKKTKQEATWVSQNSNKIHFKTQNSLKQESALEPETKKKAREKKTNQMIQILLKPLPPVKQMTGDLKSKF